MLARSQLNMYLARSALFLGSKGKVASWMPGRGFGFISDENNKEHFVHFSAVKVDAGAYRGLVVGQEVEFDLVTHEGRTRAENVTAPGGGFLPGAPKPFNDNNGGGRGGFRGRGNSTYRGGRGGGRGGYGRGGDNQGRRDQQNQSQGGDEF